MKRIICHLFSILITSAVLSFAQDEVVSPIWESTVKVPDNYFRIEKLVRTSDGGFAIIGVSGKEGMLSGLIKTNELGSREWIKIFGNDSTYVSANSCFSLPNANIALVGSIAAKTGSSEKISAAFTGVV